MIVLCSLTFLHIPTYIVCDGLTTSYYFSRSVPSGVHHSVAYLILKHLRKASSCKIILLESWTCNKCCTCCTCCTFFDAAWLTHVFTALFFQGMSCSAGNSLAVTHARYIAWCMPIHQVVGTSNHYAAGAHLAHSSLFTHPCVPSLLSFLVLTYIDPPSCCIRFVIFLEQRNYANFSRKINKPFFCAINIFI